MKNTKITQRYFKYVSLYLSSSRSIDEAFDLALKRIKNKKFIRSFETFITSLQNGKGVEECLTKLLHKEILDMTMFSLISVGYKTGDLAKYLMDVSNYVEKSISLKKKVIGSLAYPVVVLCSAFLSVVYITYIILPKIIPIFSSLKAPLPWSTKFLIYISEFISKEGVLMLSYICFTCALIFFVYIKNQTVRVYVHTNMYRVPVFGRLFSFSDIGSVALCIGTLLKSHIPISDAVEAGITYCKNLYMRSELEKLKLQLDGGSTLSQLVKGHVFNEDWNDFISLGESTGTVPQAFLDLSDFCRNEYDDQIKNLSSILEPAALVCSALVVMVVALSVISPMYLLVQHVN